MEVIKTYNEFNKADDSVNFRILRMEDIYSKNSGRTDEPHRHNYYTVLLVKQASGEHIIDFNRYPLTSSQVYFVSPGQVHQVVEKEQSSGYCIVFSPLFLIKNNIPQYFIEDLNLFNDYGQTPPLDINAGQLNKLSNYCEEIFIWNQSTLKFKEQAIGAFFKLLLIECNNLCVTPATTRTQNIEAGNSILKKFKELVNQNYAHWHATSEYANKLNITPGHLNRTVKSLTGKTAKEYIQSGISIAAKRMLYFSELSSKEIGYQLGFLEPANFSAFFKNCTGKSPSQFRKNNKAGFS
ncbi:MAG: helix-turn-helix domain-containing protein [Chlorobi bacterium]|nr:helix-turn-helix domain-containing protein [Chlorobiota bacterium]